MKKHKNTKHSRFVYIFNAVTIIIKRTFLYQKKITQSINALCNFLNNNHLVIYFKIINLY